MDRNSMLQSNCFSEKKLKNIPFYITSNELLKESSKIPHLEDRADIVHRLIESYGLLNRMRVIKAVPATYDELSTFHCTRYINYLKEMSTKQIALSDNLNDENIIVTKDNDHDNFLYGIGYDCPEIDDMYNFASVIAGGTITAARCLSEGWTDVAINWYGGWHHAQRDQAEGFCYINDIVLGIQHLAAVFKKVLYIDLDVHHGNGVENAYKFSRDVFTLSIHKHEPGFYPGTGSLDDVGCGMGKYHSVNVPLKEGISDVPYFHTFQNIAGEVLRTFQPNTVVVQCGADCITGDKLGGFNLTPIGLGHCITEILSWNKPALFLGGEDSDDDRDDESEDDTSSSKSNNSQPLQSTTKESTSQVKSTDNTKEMGLDAMELTSSTSDDSESDSGSDSEDSSSADCTSAPSLPIPVITEHEETQHRRNLKNFFPPTHERRPTPSQTAQKTESSDKSKTDDSDSSTQKSQAASSSSSDSDSESNKSNSLPSTNNRSRACSSNTSNIHGQVDDSSDEERHCRSSSQCNSSDDSDHHKPCGVVRPNQRKPPSPVFKQNSCSRGPSVLSPATANGYGNYIQQRCMSSAAEPPCIIPQHSDSDDMDMTVPSRVPINQQSYQATVSNITAMKTADKPTVNRTKGRKPKSPALSTPALEQPVKKKRGRKRTVKIPLPSESDEEEPKVKVPERRRPGRPPIKRLASSATSAHDDDAEWVGTQRKVIEHKPSSMEKLPNVWDRERRRSSLRLSSFTTVDSDSEAEIVAPPVKPTARVIPAVKGKDGRTSRDSSCDSRNDSDFNMMGPCSSKAEESPPKLDVEGMAVQDKKKSDTLRKLFSRGREEGGGKGGKGGGKGKGGVIIVESEQEHKLLSERYQSPPRRFNDRVPEIPSINQPVDLNHPPVPSGSLMMSDHIPKLVYNNGHPSLWCKIDLSKLLPPLQKFLFAVKSEEVKVKTTLSDTRQDNNISVINPGSSKVQKLEDDVKYNKKVKIEKEKTSRYYKKEKYAPVSSNRSNCLAPVNYSSDSDSEHLKRQSVSSTVNPKPSDTLDVQPTCYPTMNSDVLGIEEDNSDIDSWTNMSSCSSQSSSPSVTHNRMEKYVNNKRSLSPHLHHRHNKRKKIVEECISMHPSLTEAAPTPSHIPNTNHENSIILSWSPDMLSECLLDKNFLKSIQEVLTRGYNKANVAKCWTYLTSIIAGSEINSDIPEYQYFENFGPDFTLNIVPSNRKDLNSNDYILSVIERIKHNLRNITSKYTYLELTDGERMSLSMK